MIQCSNRLAIKGKAIARCSHSPISAVSPLSTLETQNIRLSARDCCDNDAENDGIVGLLKRHAGDDKDKCTL